MQRTPSIVFIAVLLLAGCSRLGCSRRATRSPSPAPPTRGAVAGAASLARPTARCPRPLRPTARWPLPPADAR